MALKTWILGSTIIAAAIVILILQLANCIQALGSPNLDNLKQVQAASSDTIVELELPIASGEITADNGIIHMDYSNTADGYVMIKWVADIQVENIGISITDPNKVTRVTTLHKGDGSWGVYPLTYGNGAYTIKVVEKRQARGRRADCRVFLKKIQVKLSDEFTPFLRPNYRVNYDETTIAVKAAAMLTERATTNLEKANIIYNFVISNFTYDYRAAEDAAKATRWQSTNLDRCWIKGSGLCGDLSALTVAMLRSQGIPAQMVYGHTNEVANRHAWVKVYIDDEWILRDPTYDLDESEATYRSAINYFALSVY